jgi:mannose-6-phosphate isomerase-like protein (cupin superfamily)
VLAGYGKYTDADGSYDMTKDTLTVVPPGTAHALRNTNAEPLVVLTIEGPGPFDAQVLER